MDGKRIIRLNSVGKSYLSFVLPSNIRKRYASSQNKPNALDLRRISAKPENENTPEAFIHNLEKKSVTANTRILFNLDKEDLKNANKFTVIKYFEKVLRDFTNEDPLKKKSQDEASGLDPNATSEEIETLLKLAVDKGILSEEANMAFTLHLKQIKQLNQSFIKQDTQFQNLIDQLEILKNPFLAFIHEKDSQQIITNLKKLKESNDIAKQIQFVNLVREYFKLLKENPQEVIKIDKAEFLSMLDETVIGYEDSNLSDIFQGSRPVKINLTSLEYA